MEDFPHSFLLAFWTLNCNLGKHDKWIKTIVCYSEKIRLGYNNNFKIPVIYNNKDWFLVHGMYNMTQ